MKSRAPQLPHIALFGLAAAFAVGACDAIIGAGDRELNNTIVCTGTGCACAAGLGDCDGLPDNGCETDLSSQKHCGACDRPCDNGTCAEGACSCDPGFADCDGDPATSCETSVAADSENCGACGRSCGGAECAGSLCVPEPVTFTGPMFAFDLAGQTIYFATGPDMGMFRMDIGGASPEPFGDNMLYVNLIEHDGDAVYWTSDDSIFATTTATNETTALAAMQYPGQRLAVAGGKVYWGHLDSNTNSAFIHRTSVVAGGMIEVVVDLGDPAYAGDFCVTEDHVYWADIIQIFRSPHDVAEPALFKNVEVPVGFFHPGKDALLYTGNPNGTFFVPIGAGAPKQIADLEGYGVITSDDTHAYFVTWAFGSSELYEFWKVPLTGDTPPVKIAEEQSLSPGPLRIDDTYLYWIGGPNAEIVRIVK